MDSQIFEEQVRKLDRTFRMEGRKIALLVDNCPAHPFVSDLTNVQLIFLPANTTSVLQKMGQGVIRNLKVHYRGTVVRRLCRALDKTKTSPKNIYSSGNENTSILMRSCVITNHRQLF